MFRLLLIIAASVMTLSSKAQHFSISATISDADNETLVNGDYILTTLKDAKLIKIGDFEQGKLQFDITQDGDMVLNIMALEHTEKQIFINIDKSKTHYELGKIAVQGAKILSDITIVARTPLFEKTSEGTRLNIENTILANSSSAAELLSKSPGVSVTNKTINVFGRGEALIYINNKIVPFEQFQSIPASQIKHIEIITNPSAKYEARARAVIKVTLKRSYQQGSLFTLSDNATWGKHFMNFSNLNWDFKAKKWSLNANYGLNTGTDWNINNYTNHFKTPKGDYFTKSYYEENTRQNASNYRLGLGYQINEKTDISAQYDGLYNDYKLGVQSDGNNLSPNVELTVINMFNNGTTRNINRSGNFNFNRKLDTLGSFLFAAVQYSDFGTKLFDQIKEKITQPNSLITKNLRINDSQNGIEVYTAQVDIAKKLSKSKNLDFGAKYSHINNQGAVRFFSKPDESDLPLQEYPQYANGSDYNENVSAVYALFNQNFTKWNLGIGGRSEYSDIEGFSKKTNTYIIDTAYINFFPNLKINYTLSNIWAANFSFARRINRPLYQDLDPFLWYLDSLNSIQGNPYLRPEITNSLEWNLTYKSFNLKLGYALTNNAIRMVTRNGIGGLNSVIYTKDNINLFRQYNVAIDIPFELSKYNSYTTFALNFNEYKDSRPEFAVQNYQPQFYVYTYHQFKLPKSISLDLSGEYYSAANNGFTRLKPYYYTTLAVSKPFFDKKLNLQLTWNDVFRTAVWGGVRTVGNITSDFNQIFNVRYLRVSATYKYGTLKKAAYRNKSINQNEIGRLKT